MKSLDDNFLTLPQIQKKLLIYKLNEISHLRYLATAEFYTYKYTFILINCISVSKTEEPWLSNHLGFTKLLVGPGSGAEKNVEIIDLQNPSSNCLNVDPFPNKVYGTAGDLFAK